MKSSLTYLFLAFLTMAFVFFNRVESDPGDAERSNYDDEMEKRYMRFGRSRSGGLSHDAFGRTELSPEDYASSRRGSSADHDDYDRYLQGRLAVGDWALAKRYALGGRRGGYYGAVDDSNNEDTLEDEVDKRYMRFGKRYMRFGRSTDGKRSP